MARWTTTVILTTVAVGVGLAFGLPASADPIPVGERCDRFSSAWSGAVVVGGDVPTVVLDLEVPGAVPGEIVRVESVVSDGDVAVSVGGVIVDGGGDELSGGAVAVHHDGAPVTVSTVALEIARCALVAQALLPAPTTGQFGSPAGPPSGLPVAALPSTGAATLGLAVAALVTLVAGGALVVGARRAA